MAKKSQESKETAPESVETPTTQVAQPGPAEGDNGAENGTEGRPTSKTNPELAQFPATIGEPEVEVEKRSADNTGANDMRWRKTFVVFGEAWSGDEEAFHERNKLATLQAAIHQGVRPKGEATFDGVEDHADGVSKCVNYSVEVEPASTDENSPETTVTPLQVLDEKLDGSTETNA